MSNAILLTFRMIMSNQARQSWAMGRPIQHRCCIDRAIGYWELSMASGRISLGGPADRRRREARAGPGVEPGQELLLKRHAPAVGDAFLVPLENGHLVGRVGELHQH
jgi:hypothetical protein